MSENVLEWQSELATLPARDRAALAYFLLESLDEHSDPEAEAAWDVELQCRVDDIQHGRAIGVPASEVFAQLRKRFP